MKCAQCGKDVLIPFRCNYCGKYFCENHRLLESHNCSEAPTRTPLGSQKAKQLIANRKDITSSEELRTIIENIPIEGRKVTFVNEGDLHYYKQEIIVPEEVFSDRTYSNRIKHAKTVEEVRNIVYDYYKHKK